MKKEERINRLFGDIDDDLVADAAYRPIPIKVWLPRVTAAVAAVALTVGLAVAQPWATEKPPVADSHTAIDTTTDAVNDGNSTTTTTVQQGAHEISPGVPVDTSPAIDEPSHVAPPVPTGGTPTTTAPTEGGVWYEPKWEDKPIWQRFPEFERKIPVGYDGKMHYTVRDTNIDKTMVMEYLEDVNLHGYDIYTETAYDVVGKVYRIKGINPICAVALQYPDRSDFFPAINFGYKPDTLGEFIIDLNLREHLRVGTVYHSYRDADGTFHDKEYAGLTVEKVWEMLLCDDALRNEYDEENWQRQWNTKISIRIDMPLLGYHNISISLSENGYLRTNLLDTEKLFYIGEDKVDAFMAYVEENCRLQKDDELIPMPNDTDSRTDTTMTTPAQPPLKTGTTVWKKPDPVD